MKEKNTDKRKLACLKARGAGQAAATRGRARRFVDRKKETARKACRGQ